MTKLDLGKTVCTNKVRNNLTDAELGELFSRHQAGDWGDLCQSDKNANEKALVTGQRILSAYNTERGKVWIITEWDRSYTTVLYPDEY